MDLGTTIDAAYGCTVLLARAQRDGQPCDNLRRENAALRKAIADELRRRGWVEMTTERGVTAMLRQGTTGCELIVMPTGVSS